MYNFHLCTIISVTDVTSEDRINSAHVSQFQPLFPLPPLHRRSPRSHDVCRAVGSRWDHRLPGCREICASSEGRARTRTRTWTWTFPRALTWYVGWKLTCSKIFMEKKKCLHFIHILFRTYMNTSSHIDSENMWFIRCYTVIVLSRLAEAPVGVKLSTCNLNNWSDWNYCLTFPAAHKEKDSDGEDEKEKKKKEEKGIKNEKVPKKEEKKSTGKHLDFYTVNLWLKTKEINSTAPPAGHLLNCNVVTHHGKMFATQKHKQVISHDPVCSTKQMFMNALL